MISYILDDLVDHGVREIVFIVGYLREVIRDFIAREYPEIRAHYVVQETQDGTAGAIKLAEPFADEELLILFVDTLFDADLDLIDALDPGYAGVIWAKEVEDYQRFGVIVTRDDGTMERIVEKPTEPISKLANIGLYSIRDYALLFEGVNDALAGDPGPGGEFFLTDAFQYMVDHGGRILTAPVEGWYDCGKPGTLIETNAHLLATSRGGVDPAARVEEVEIVEPVRIEAGAVVSGGRIGPNVTLSADVRVTDSELRDAIVGARTEVRDARLHDSLVGADARIEGMKGSLNVTAHSEVRGDG